MAVFRDQVHTTSAEFAAGRLAAADGSPHGAAGPGRAPPAARRGCSMTAATAIDAAPRPAPAAKASWYPLVRACADVPSPVRQVARVVSRATPSAAPTCCVVLNAPEMTPASASVAPAMPR